MKKIDVLVPVSRMMERVELAKADSNSAYFQTLLYANEFLVKWCAVFFVSSIADDKERNRYRSEHMLVHADGIGDWVSEVMKIFSGPAFSALDDKARPYVKEFTEKIKKGDWRYDVAADMRVAAKVLGAEQELPVKVSLCSWLLDFSYIRNKTRGHGAISSAIEEQLLGPLARTFYNIINNLSVLTVSCAYIRQNVSGKYKVSLIGGDDSAFAILKSSRDLQYQDGVYFALGSLRYGRLICSDPDLFDFLLPNGGFNDKTYEVLSYITGSVQSCNSRDFHAPVDALPSSETKGTSELDVLGNVLTNLPIDRNIYVARKEFEELLRLQLCATDRHPIITIDGRGGIGKTSSALHVVRSLAQEQSCPYECIIWFSARDIDLTISGAKSVRPEGVNIDDFSSRYVELMTGSLGHAKSEAREMLAKALGRDSEYRTLFVFDNFETVESPAELFGWIDEFIRPPNKALITTRIRRFKADFPIHLQGMKDDECVALIHSVAQKLCISELLTPQLIEQFSIESSGHPYVIKIMLGELAKNRNVKKIERVMASRDDVLSALFERTFSMLSIAAQRIFLTIANWRSLVSELAVEAVLIRPGNDMIDVPRAVEELVDFSFVDMIISRNNEEFLSVPLAAQVFGREKLRMSPIRGAITEDLKLLQQFGVLQKIDTVSSVESRLRNLFRNIERVVENGERKLDDFRPIIEYVARKIPQAWLFLADLCRGDDRLEAKYLTTYLEKNGTDDIVAWWRLINLFERLILPKDALNALAQLVRARDASIHDVSEAINRANYLLSKYKSGIDFVDRKLFMSELADAMRGKEKLCSARDLSRLAWLHLKLKERQRAYDLVKMGLEKQPRDTHCLRLYEILDKEFSGQ